MPFLFCVLKNYNFSICRKKDGSLHVLRLVGMAAVTDTSIPCQFFLRVVGGNLVFQGTALQTGFCANVYAQGGAAVDMITDSTGVHMGITAVHLAVVLIGKCASLRAVAHSMATGGAGLHVHIPQSFVSTIGMHNDAISILSE